MFPAVIQGHLLKNVVVTLVIASERSIAIFQGHKLVDLRSKRGIVGIALYRFGNERRR